jgi:hypothetical protein
VYRGRHPAPVLVMATHPELYSGKHKATGMNVQVACAITGRLSWISDPVPGSRTTAIAWANLESSSRLTRETGSAIKDMSATECSLHSRSQKAANSCIGRKSSTGRSINPLRHRAGHRQRQDLAHHAHRLSKAHRYIRYDHLSRGRPALLQDRLNNPHA